MFAAVLRDGNEARARLERKKLESAKMQFEEPKKNCEFEKEEQRRERENNYKLELECINLILQTVREPDRCS